MGNEEWKELVKKSNAVTDYITKNKDKITKKQYGILKKKICYLWQFVTDNDPYVSESLRGRTDLFKGLE